MVVENYTLFDEQEKRIIGGCLISKTIMSRQSLCSSFLQRIVFFSSDWNVLNIPRCAHGVWSSLDHLETSLAWSIPRPCQRSSWNSGQHHDTHTPENRNKFFCLHPMLGIHDLYLSSFGEMKAPELHVFCEQVWQCQGHVWAVSHHLLHKGETHKHYFSWRKISKVIRAPEW